MLCSNDILFLCCAIVKAQLQSCGRSSCAQLLKLSCNRTNVVYWACAICKPRCLQKLVHHKMFTRMNSLCAVIQGVGIPDCECAFAVIVSCLSCHWVNDLPVRSPTHSTTHVSRRAFWSVLACGPEHNAMVNTFASIMLNCLPTVFNSC